MIARLAALCLLCLVPSVVAATETFAIHFISRADDPRYAPRRAYTGLVLREFRRPVDGARSALRGGRIQGRRLGLTFELAETELAPDEPAAARILALAPGVALLDLPAAEVAALAGELGQRDDLLLFNVRNPDDALRRLCEPALFHTGASRAMLADALAQYLVARNWKEVLILQGPEAADALDVAAFTASAEKFGLEITDTRDFVVSNDPRRRAQNNVLLLTSGDYDVVYLADTLGEFGRYVPYSTQLPRPVVGSEGLTPLGWHWSWERHGAPQLNQRFDRRAKRRMTQHDWAAWMAVRSVIEAIVRTGSTGIVSIRDFLLSPALTLDTYKGTPGSFRPWSQQLRQPVLLATHNAVIDRAPLDGFLHPVTTLDTLGVDKAQHRCQEP